MFLFLRLLALNVHVLINANFMFCDSCEFCVFNKAITKVKCQS